MNDTNIPINASDIKTSNRLVFSREQYEQLLDQERVAIMRKQLIDRLNAITDRYIRGEFEMVGFPRAAKPGANTVFIQPKTGVCSSGVLHSVRFGI